MLLHSSNPPKPKSWNHVSLAESRRGREKDPAGSPYEQLMRCWMCRLLLGFRSFQVFLSNESGESVLVRDFIGVEPLEGVLPRSSVQRQVEKRLKRLGNPPLGSASPLGRNTANLATLAGLSEVEREILAF